MAASIGRAYNLDAYTAAGLPMPSDELRFADARRWARSITIVNPTNALLAIWLDRPPATGTPRYQILPGYYYTIPITAKSVGLAVLAQKGSSPSGVISVEMIDEALSASSGILPSSGNSSFVWDQSAWDNGNWS